VYVVELATEVRRDRRFIRQNRYTKPDQTCLYVGSTGLDPEVRYVNHLRGHKGCPLVRDHAIRLRPDLFADFPAMTWEDAIATEEATLREAEACRREGIVVNVFLLSGWSQSREDIQFAYKLAQTAQGRVFFTSGKDLDRFVVWDYVSRRRSIIG